MIDLSRYIAASCLGPLRWVAPSLVFVLGLAIIYGPAGGPLPALATGAAWLFPITAWLTVGTLNNEDPSQADITAAAGGGVERVRVAKLIVAAGVGVVMAGISLVAAYATNLSSFDVNDLAAGVVAHAYAIISGVTLGSLCARPLLRRTSWSVLIIVGLTVIDLIVPGAPPVRLALDALNATQASHMWLTLGIGAGEVAILAVALLVASKHLSRARS